MFRSLRALLLTGTAVVLVAALALMAWSAWRLLDDTLEERFAAEAELAEPLLAAAVGPLLASRDYATLAAVVQRSVEARGLGHLAVLDSGGREVARARASDATHVLPLSMPVVVEGQRLGTIELGIRTDARESARAALLERATGIGALLVAVSVLLLGITATWLTRGFRQLAEASRRVADGDYHVALPSSRLADVQQVTQAF